MIAIYILLAWFGLSIVASAVLAFGIRRNKRPVSNSLYRSQLRRAVK